MVTYLPEVLVVKILSWLPPKSLIRFKCVCKTWHALIGSPDFLSKNLLNHSILTQYPCDPRRLILFIAKARDKSKPGKSIFKHSFRSYDSLHCASQTPLNLPPLTSRLRIVASCNGLLCLWELRRSEIYVWNPATSSELKALAAAPSRCHAKSSTARNYLGFDDVGFGFDSVSNDFKVVMLDKEEYGGLMEAKVYSLKSGCWRLLDMSASVSVYFRLHYAMLSAGLDGVFLWYTDVNRDLRNDRIVAFDFSEEEFITMMYPDLEVEDTLFLMKLKGSVAMVVFPALVKEYMHIWVMLEFGFSELWTRLLSIELPLHLVRPLGFWKNGELFMENREGQVVLYDLLAQTETNLQFEGFLPSVVDCNFVQLEGMGSGVIPTPSCSSRLHYTIDHEDCRRKQQKIERKLEETQILLLDMQERTAKMEEKIDMLMALVRPGVSFGGNPIEGNL